MPVENYLTNLADLCCIPSLKYVGDKNLSLMLLYENTFGFFLNYLSFSYQFDHDPSNSTKFKFDDGDQYGYSESFNVRRNFKSVFFY